MPAPHTLTRSSHQQAVLDFVRSGVGHGVVLATAGSGKTFTLTEVAGVLPQDLEARYLAYNAHVARELASRLPRHVRAQTIHALGKRALQARYPGVRQAQVNPGKARKLVRAYIDELQLQHRFAPEDRSDADAFLASLLHFARVNLTDSRDTAAVRALALRYNLTPPADPVLERACLEGVRVLLRRGDQAVEAGNFDFDDMLYVPVVRRLPVPQFDFVLIDEAQDLSPLQLEFTLKTVRPGGRQLFMGDPRQSINGFTGADADAMNRILTRIGGTVLTLPVTYRCPRSHVALAKKLAPEIEAAPGAPEGRVFVIPDTALPKWIQPGDLVLCRYNAPLIGRCLEAIRAGKPAALQGKDLGGTLTGLARRVFLRGLTHWEAQLADHRRAERERIEREVGDATAAAALLAQREDLAESLGHLTRAAVREGARDLQGLAEFMAAFFARSHQTITFSTVHGAKGREADRVFVLHPHLMPAVYARTPEAVIGEACVQFVALTRARRDLIFVEEAGQAPPPLRRGRR
ncbi:ATP-dependent DNA helicase Rep [Deinococcus carri]|uniref:DNA 3'-5' helicase n=1 Tax=Deinococcus carri TaxID=1211323 RepID=A0ABP9W6T7_9DEIO